MLKKDVLELCLLSLMSQGDQYGYELLRRLHAVFPDVQESAIYAILRQLCREGATERYQGETSGGPVRKYYRLTELGREQLEQLTEDWRRLQGIMAALGIAPQEGMP